MKAFLQKIKKKLLHLMYVDVSLWIMVGLCVLFIAMMGYYNYYQWYYVIKEEVSK